MRMENVAFTGLESYGWDRETFGILLDFVAQLSVVLWSLVILTAIIRFLGLWLYRSSAARTALIESGYAIRVEPYVVGRLDLVQPSAGHLADVGPIPLRRSVSAQRVLVDASMGA